MNRVALSGVLTKDPELKQGSNYKLVNLTVETKRKVKTGRGEAAEWKDEIECVEVTAWGQTADFVLKYFTAGSGVIVDGRLKVNAWESQGKNYTKLTVVAENVEFPPGGGGKRATTPAAMEPVRQAVGARPPTPSPGTAKEEEGDDSVPF